MNHSAITFERDRPFDVEVVEKEHQDGAPNIALQNVETKSWLTVDDVAELPLSWRDESEKPGAWQRFIAVPGGYLARRDNGKRLVLKAGPWEQQ